MSDVETKRHFCAGSISSGTSDPEVLITRFSYALARVLPDRAREVRDDFLEGDADALLRAVCYLNNCAPSGYRFCVHRRERDNWGFWPIFRAAGAGDVEREPAELHRQLAQLADDKGKAEAATAEAREQLATAKSAAEDLELKNGELEDQLEELRQRDDRIAELIDAVARALGVERFDDSRERYEAFRALDDARDALREPRDMGNDVQRLNALMAECRPRKVRRVKGTGGERATRKGRSSHAKN